MTKSRKSTLLLAGIAALALLAHALPGRAQSGTVTTSLSLPFPATASVNGELVRFAGTIHMVVQAVPPNPTVPPNPIVPPNPVRIYTNLEDVVGEGDTTHTIYRVTGTSQRDFTAPPPNGYEFTAGYAVNSAPPIRLGYQVQVAADGSVVGQPNVFVSYDYDP
jgi:hypothetical protein